MELKALYQEIILDHGKNPRNKGKCDEFNKEAKAHNPLCGDKVHIYLKLNKKKKVEDLSFEGEGCAISLASASILTDVIKGKDSFTVDSRPSDAIAIAVRSNVPVFVQPEVLEKAGVRIDNEKGIIIGSEKENKNL